MKMPKLKDFAEAKRKFKTDEDAEYYFVLVELYEKHLKPEQKENFLSAETIDGMLDVLDSKQLRYLKQLIVALTDIIYTGGKTGLYPNPNYIKQVNESYSEWFRNNVLYRGCKVPLKSTDTPEKPKLPDMLELINIITKHIGLNDKSKKKQGGKEESDLIKQYKSRLKRFDGDSVEYRQWLILLDVDNSIPNIDRIYDVNKLLKQLDLERLKSLKRLVGEKDAVKIIKADMKHLEPYYYWLDAVNSGYTSDDYFMDIGFAVAVSSHRTADKGLVEAFNISLRELNSKIDEIIAEKTKEKEELVDLKIKGLVRSKRFGEDMMEISRLTVGTDDIVLRNAISDYCRTGVNGGAFNNYLRRAILLRTLKEEMEEIATKGGESSASATMKFRKAIDKVYEYFRNHLTSQEYTVYRGMRSDGLAALLDKSSPRIEYEKDGKSPILNDTLISKINKCKPVVFDEGLTSTSLNKGVSAVGFRGKDKGSIFFTIKIPSGSKALILDYEGINDVPFEEEVLLAPRTKIRINKIKEVDGHYEIDAEVVN